MIKQQNGPYLTEETDQDEPYICLQRILPCPNVTLSNSRWQRGHATDTSSLPETMSFLRNLDNGAEVQRVHMLALACQCTARHCNASKTRCLTEGIDADSSAPALLQCRCI